MTTSARIIDTLKRQLKLRGMTYKALAEHLELSESAVKHMFSTGNFSLRRLDDVCAILELDIGDLVDISESQEQKIEQLSDDNERLAPLKGKLGLADGDAGGSLTDEQVEALLVEHREARASRNFARSDEIRDQLLESGIIVEDSRDGVRWRRK